MSYLVLARKWRPSRFDEIIGQEHVTRALCNAIELDRVAHAFLFAGARGVGKTTAARVLAKALQCEKGPTKTPCGICNACTEVTAGNCIDVFEIDGASNRGINEIRELRDSVAYAPQRDRFKIYIIDEVHMLTQEAFNALLKTLEEPPKHVKFVFATTEPQKIPVTILSRCQRYDFKRVPLTLIKKHLDMLLEKEGVSIPEEGVRMVARESEGSVRDSLSLLDRVISFAGDSADEAMVADCLGVADRKWLHGLLKSLLSGDTSSALQVIEDVNHYGFDLRAFCADVLNTVRDLIVVKVCGGKTKQVELSDAEIKALAKLSEQHSIVALQRMFQILLRAADEVAASRHPRLALEMAVIQCCTVNDMQAVPEILTRLESLEQRLANGTYTLPQPAETPGAQAGRTPRAATGQSANRESKPVTESAADPEPEPDTQAKTDSAPEPPARFHEIPAPTEIADPIEPAKAQPPEPQREPEPTPEPITVAPEPANVAPAAKPNARKENQRSRSRGRGEQATTVQTKASKPVDWPTFVSQVKDSDPLLASILENAQVIESTKAQLTLGFSNSFYCNQLTAGPNHDRMSALLLEHCPGIALAVKQVEETEGTLAEEADANLKAAIDKKKQQLTEHPITQAVIDSMQGTLIDVKIDNKAKVEETESE